jgi:hypothetical protein
MRELIERIEEAAYQGNLGFAEMMQFFKVATKEQESLMDKYLKKNDFASAWSLLKKVTGVKLQSFKSVSSKRVGMGASL